MQKRSSRTLYAITGLSALLITYFGIAYNQQILRMLPLYVSLVIGLLQSKASRYASLLGSANSLLYTVVYASLSLYANAAYALLASFPLQLLTFFRWKKNAYKHSTKFQQLNKKQWIFLAAAFTLSFVVVNFILHKAGSAFRFWDNSSTLLSLAISVLTIFAFLEYTWFMLINGLITIGMYIAMSTNDAAQLTFLVYSCQSFICVVMQFVSVKHLYREQEEML